MNKLKVLFVPHCPAGSQGWEGSRPYHLCRQLGRLCDLHVVTWHQSLRSIKGASLGAYQTESMPGETRYKMWLLPNLYRLVTRGYPRSFETADQVARGAAQLALYDLPDDYFSSFIPTILSLGEADVTAAAVKHIDPARLLSVVVGDREKLMPSLKTLDLGDVADVSVT